MGLSSRRRAYPPRIPLRLTRRYFVVWFLLAIGTVVALFARKANAGTSFRSGGSGKPMANAMGYTTSSWIPKLTPACQIAGIPPEFAASAVEEESGGNPCAIGAQGAMGPDGNPREMGIMQFYNPDDLGIIKLTGNQLRAYCQGPDTENVTRQLSDDEMNAQVNAVVLKISQMRSYAGHYGVLAKIQWPSDSVDFWRLVKLVHGLPGLVQGIVEIAQHLGRAPISWSEYRSTITNNPGILDKGTEKYRSDFAAIFDNAEKATAAMSGPELS